jgi:signal transduction histidine kinase
MEAKGGLPPEAPPRGLFEPLPLRTLWRLTNRQQEFDGVAVRWILLLFLIFYGIISILRHAPDQPALLWLHTLVLAYAAVGCGIGPRFSWAALRAYAVGFAILLPVTTAVLQVLHGNHIADLSLTALSACGPLLFLLTAADVLAVLAVLAVGTTVLVISAPPAGMSVAVAGLVIGGAVVSGAAAGLVLIVFRARVAESTAWWQQACVRERALREFVELAVPMLGDQILARECAARFHNVFGIGHCAIVLLDPDEGRPRVAATAGPAPHDAGSAVSPSPEALAALFAAVADRQPLVRERLTGTDVRRFADLPWLSEGGTLVVLPIVRDETVAGAIVLSATAPRPIVDEELLLWRAMAHQVGVAVGTARLFARLQHALRARGEFMNTMSHELRSPLHVILGYADMLAEGRHEPAFIGTRVRASALELMQLVDNTLAAARLDTGKLRIQPSEFRLADLVADLRESVQALPEAGRGVPVRWDAVGDLPPVRLDRLRMKEIVHNLVSNALKFTERGEVVVRLAREGSRVRVDVRDTGPGIPPESQQRVFEMFERLETAQEPRVAGVGLGLYIVKSLVQMMGGTITLSSELGRGSCFTVWLPIRIESA